MVFFNHATRQMTAKIVYYGPGLCGKTTNLSAIYDRTALKARGEMVSLNTETDRTLFFDLLPLEVGVIGGFKAKLQLYTVPGQVFYNSTRKLVLKGVDGIVFVADSQAAMLDANRESMENLTENLRELGLDFADVPAVFQWNKRDLKQIVSIETLEEELNPRGLPSFQAIARTGEGVFETLKGISRLALAHIKRTHLAEGAPSQGDAPRPVAAGVEAPAHQGSAVPPWSAPTPVHNGAGHPAAATPSAREGRTPELPAPALAPFQSQEALAEALSFLDLAPLPDVLRGAQGEVPRTGDGSLKVMAPMFVKVQPPYPAKPPMPLGPNGLPIPRLSLRPPAPRIPPMPWPPPPLQPTASGGLRPVQVLQVAVPPEPGGGELEVQVVIRRLGVQVAEAGTSIPWPGGDGSGTLSIELKRS